MPLIVKPISATLVKNTDFFGKSDPYAIILVGSQKQRSRTCNGGGKKPSWTDTFQFSSTDPLLRVQVYDEDLFTRDDFIGEGTIGLGQFYGSPMRTENEYIDLINAGKSAGRILLSIEYQGPPLGNQNYNQGWGNNMQMGNQWGGNQGWGGNQNGWGSNNQGGWGSNNQGWGGNNQGGWGNNFYENNGWGNQPPNQAWTNQGGWNSSQGGWGQNQGPNRGGWGNSNQGGWGNNSQGWGGNNQGGWGSNSNGNQGWGNQGPNQGYWGTNQGQNQGWGNNQYGRGW